jgi:hypothetical protein
MVIIGSHGSDGSQGVAMAAKSLSSVMKLFGDHMGDPYRLWTQLLD